MSDAIKPLSFEFDEDTEVFLAVTPIRKYGVWQLNDRVWMAYRVHPEFNCPYHENAHKTFFGESGSKEETMRHCWNDYKALVANLLTVYGQLLLNLKTNSR
jgi:hypothetical protein